MMRAAGLNTPQFTGGEFRPEIASSVVAIARHVGQCEHCQFVYRVKIRYRAGSVSDYSDRTSSLSSPKSFLVNPEV